MLKHVNTCAQSHFIFLRFPSGFRAQSLRSWNVTTFRATVWVITRDVREQSFRLSLSVGAVVRRARYPLKLDAAAARPRGLCARWALLSVVYCAASGVRRVQIREAHRLERPASSPGWENATYSRYTCNDKHCIDSDFSESMTGTLLDAAIIINDFL